MHYSRQSVFDARHEVVRLAVLVTQGRAAATDATTGKKLTLRQRAAVAANAMQTQLWALQDARLRRDAERAGRPMPTGARFEGTAGVWAERRARRDALSETEATNAATATRGTLGGEEEEEGGGAIGAETTTTSEWARAGRRVTTPLGKATSATFSSAQTRCPLSSARKERISSRSAARPPPK